MFLLIVLILCSVQVSAQETLIPSRSLQSLCLDNPRSPGLQRACAQYTQTSIFLRSLVDGKGWPLVFAAFGYEAYLRAVTVDAQGTMAGWYVFLGFAGLVLIVFLVAVFVSVPSLLVLVRELALLYVKIRLTRLISNARSLGDATRADVYQGLYDQFVQRSGAQKETHERTDGSSKKDAAA